MVSPNPARYAIAIALAYCATLVTTPEEPKQDDETPPEPNTTPTEDGDA